MMVTFEPLRMAHRSLLYYVCLSKLLREWHSLTPTEYSRCSRYVDVRSPLVVRFSALRSVLEEHATLLSDPPAVVVRKSQISWTIYPLLVQTAYIDRSYPSFVHSWDWHWIAFLSGLLFAIRERSRCWDECFGDTSSQLANYACTSAARINDVRNPASSRKAWLDSLHAHDPQLRLSHRGPNAPRPGHRVVRWAVLICGSCRLLIHTPQVAWNFLRRKPRTASETQLQYIASLDPGVAQALTRGFVWVENSIWREEAEHRSCDDNAQDARCTVALAGKDVITDTGTLGSYLTRQPQEGVKWYEEPAGLRDEEWKNEPWTGTRTKPLEVMWFPELNHAEIFDNKADRDRLIQVMESYTSN